MQRLGPIVQALVLIDASELGQRDRDVRVLRAEQRAPHRQRPFERLAGGRVVALVGQHDAEIVERLRDADVLGAERLLSAGERLFEQLLRLVECRRAADRSGPSSSASRPAAQAAPARSFCTCSAPASSSARTVGSPDARADRVRIRARQQAHQQLAHLDRLGGLAFRAVALGRQPRRVERRQAADEQARPRRT